MGIADYNVSKVNWKVDNKDFAYIKLNELVEGREYPFLGCFISKDNGYGEGAVIITADYNVNVPSRYVDLFRRLMMDPKVVKQANEGKAAFKYEKFYSEKYRRDGYRLIFVDIK